MVNFLGSFNLHVLRVLDVEFVPHTHKIVSLSADKLICWNNPIVSNASNGATTTNVALNNVASVHLGVLEFKRNRLADFICMNVGN